MGDASLTSLARAKREMNRRRVETAYPAADHAPAPTARRAYEDPRSAVRPATNADKVWPKLLRAA
jgi:hypothetical protein